MPYPLRSLLREHAAPSGPPNSTGGYPGMPADCDDKPSMVFNVLPISTAALNFAKENDRRRTGQFECLQPGARMGKCGRVVEGSSLEN